MARPEVGYDEWKAASASANSEWVWETVSDRLYSTFGNKDVVLVATGDGEFVAQ